MSRRSNQKLKLLYLSKILLDMTDERRGMTLTEILKELSKYGIETGRKSLYDDMEALRVYGFDICSKRDRFVRYYINDRTFNRVDVKLISDLLNSSPLLGDAKSAELIKKLWQGEYMKGIMLPERDGMQTDRGDAVYKNLEVIYKAIIENKAISFKYFEWNSHKQRILCREGEKMLLSPWDLTLKDGRYSAVGFDHDKREVSAFFVDRMLSLAISERNRIGENEFLNERHRGEIVSLRLLCKNSGASYLFDRFGVDVAVLSNKEDEFEATVKTSVDSSLLSWVFLSEGHVRILSPDWAAEKYNELIKKSLKG